MAQFAKGVTSYEAEFRIIRPDGEIRWCVGTAAATVDKGGRVVRVSGVTVDITERKHAEERQNLLAREVDHRAKNALALAQSIVRLTRGEDVKAYIQAVEGRISALARVHTILSLSSWQGAKIGKLVDEELAPYAMGDQITLSGSEIQLQPATAQTLALALHELVTNSAKYGALSTLSGRLALKWEVDDDLLTLAWQETDGPLVQKPTSRGFGTRSVIASIELQLGGQAEFDWRPEGLICRLSVPIVAASRRTGAGSASKRSSWIGSRRRRCFRRDIARSADRPFRPPGRAGWDETVFADIRRRRALMTPRRSRAPLFPISRPPANPERARASPDHVQAVGSLQEDIDDREVELGALEFLQSSLGAGGFDDLEMMDAQHDADHRTHIGWSSITRIRGKRVAPGTASSEPTTDGRIGIDVGLNIPRVGKDAVTAVRRLWSD